MPLRLCLLTVASAFVLCGQLLQAFAAVRIAPLGALPAYTYSFATGISSNGSVVVGSSGNTTNILAFRWTPAAGMVALPNISGASQSQAYAVSADGKVIVGTCLIAGQWEAFRWAEGTGMTILGDAPGVGPQNIRPVPKALSADSGVIVGNYGGHAFLWKPTVGMISLREMESAAAVSADGQYVFGRGYTTNGAPVAAVWYQGSFGFLPLLPGGSISSALAASSSSPDYGVCVVGVAEGRAQSTTGDTIVCEQAFRYNGLEMEGLGTLRGDLFGGHHSEALSVSADGLLVVGYSYLADNGNVAFIWRQGDEAGMRFLGSVVDYGLTYWNELPSATGISADGRWIVGFGHSARLESEAFIVDLQAPEAQIVLTNAMLLDGGDFSFEVRGEPGTNVAIEVRTGFAPSEWTWAGGLEIDETGVARVVRPAAWVKKGNVYFRARKERDGLFALPATAVMRTARHRF